MREIILKIQFDDEGGYKGHGDDTAKLIKDGLENYINIDLVSDGVIKDNWSVINLEGKSYSQKEVEALIEAAYGQGAKDELSGSSFYVSNEWIERNLPK